MKGFLRIFALSLGVALVFYTGFVLFENLDDLQSIHVRFSKSVLLYPFVILLNLLSSGRLFDCGLGPVRSQISLVESLTLSAIVRLTNYVTPGPGGVAVRIAVLRATKGLSVTAGIRSAFQSTALLLFIGATATLCVVTIDRLQLLESKGAKLPLLLISGCGVAVLGIVCGIWFARGFRSLLEVGSATINHMIFSGALWQSLCWGSLLFLSFSFLLYCELSIFSVTADLPAVFVVTLVTRFGALLKVTPAGLGVQEGLLIASGSMVGLPEAEMLAVAALRRAGVSTISAITAFVGSPFVFRSPLLQLLRDIKSRSK